jgi:hypothetical protein
MIAMLLALSFFRVYADVDSDNLLRSLSISVATETELAEMAKARGLPVGPEEEMRSALYAFYSIEPYDLEESLDAGDFEYTLQVLHADSITDNLDGTSRTLLEGHVNLLFSTTADGGEKKLSADKVVVDLANKRLSAFGSVTWDDGSGTEGLGSVTAKVISFWWERDVIQIAEGETEIDRTTSEGETITFHALGDQAMYQDDGANVWFGNGTVSTSKEHAYSSITAKDIYVLNEGDLLVQNAYLSIGRVPILWAPFFFFPGSRMVGNPAIGFSSSRGMFVNTTFELYGTYPDIEDTSDDSLTSLLSNPDTEQGRPDGPIYTNDVTDVSVSDLDRWADETESYMVLFADSYEESGISLGIQTSDMFLDQQVSLYSDLRIAVHPDGTDVLEDYSSFPVLRYMGETEIAVDTDRLDFTFSFPLYSDPEVKQVYGNRLTTFSVTSLLGMYQSFPSDYSSDITSYTWSAEGSYKAPVSGLSPYIETLELDSLEASVEYDWQTDDDGNYDFRMESVTLPELNASMSGTLFEWERTATVSDGEETDQFSLASERLQEGEQAFAFAAPVPLDDPYRTSTSDSSDSSDETETETRSFSITYDIDQYFSYDIEPSDDYITDSDNQQTVYDLTETTIGMYAELDPSFFTFSQTFSPDYSLELDDSATNYKYEKLSLSASSVVQIPILGLTYTLSELLYSYSASYYTDDSTEYSSSYFDFTSEYVTTHELEFEKSFLTATGSLTPSMTATLPPLDITLLPAISYSGTYWTFYDSFKFTEDDGVLEPTYITSKASFDNDRVSFSLTGTYDLSSYEDSPWDPFDLSGSFSVDLYDNLLSFTQEFDFEALSSDDEENYFSSISSELSVPWVTTALEWTGTYDQLELSTWDTSISIGKIGKYWWKNRIHLELGLDTSLSLNFEDYYDSSFDITASVAFSIAELFDFTFSVTSTNQGFNTYYVNDVFSFDALWSDLCDSFDFFGDGRYSTQFNMSSIAVELTHYMDDWTLNCKYEGSIVLSDNQYSWEPTVTVYLQWVSIPELTVDESWTEESDVWSSS